MTINYKRELELASKSMILVHEPDMLIKMIVRMIVQKVRVTHAGILLYDRQRNSYVLTVSRGPLGVKIPSGFARIDADNPFIRLLMHKNSRRLLSSGAFVTEQAQRQLRRKLDASTKELVRGALHQMDMFGAVVGIPSYFREGLLGVLLLGRKRSSRPFTAEELDFFIAIASDVAMAIRNAQLFRELEAELERNHRLFIHTTIALAAAIDAKDHYTHGHTARVTNLALEIAREMMPEHKEQITEEFLRHLHIAGLLHDIGKIGIPESILNKQGPLDPQERNRMNEHPLVGATILEPIKELAVPILGVKHHHERYDGTGYPQGLKGQEIPLIAAIISVADAFDAMTTDRPYRKGFTKDAAVNEVRQSAGTQFNPGVVAALSKLYEESKL